MTRSSAITAEVAPPDRRLDAPPLVRSASWWKYTKGCRSAGDQRSVLVQQRLEQRSGARIRVRLEAEEDVVDRTDLGRVVGRVGVGGEALAGF